MKKTITTIVATLLVALAFNSIGGGFHDRTTTTSTSSAESRSTAKNVNNINQRTSVSGSTRSSSNSNSQGGHGGSGGNAAGGNSETRIDFDEDYEASAIAPPVSIAVSGPCTGTAIGGSAAVQAFALGATKANEDKECTKRETIRVLSELCKARVFPPKQTQDVCRSAYLVAMNQREVKCITRPEEHKECSNSAFVPPQNKQMP